MGGFVAFVMAVGIWYILDGVLQPVNGVDQEAGFPHILLAALVIYRQVSLLLVPLASPNDCCGSLYLAYCRTPGDDLGTEFCPFADAVSFDRRRMDFEDALHMDPHLLDCGHLRSL